MVDDHAGLAAHGLFELLDRRHIHGHVLALPGLGVPDGQHGGLGDGLVGGLLSAAGNDHMAAVELLHMEPEVALLGVLQGQLVVLPVVPAHPDQIALAGAELPGLGGGQLHLLFLVGVPDVAPGHQLGPDLQYVLLGLGPVQLVENAVEVLELHLALGDLLGQHPLGRLGPVVVLVELGGVLLGRELGGEGNVDLPHLRVVEVHGGEPRLSPGHGVEVGGDDVAQLPQALPVGGGGDLLPLILQLPGRPVPEIADGLVEAVGPEAHPLGVVTPGVEAVQQGREAGETLVFHVAAVLLHRVEGEVPVLALFFQQHRLGILRQGLKGFEDLSGQGFPPLQGQGAQLGVGLAQEPVGQLPADQGREAPVPLQQPLFQPLFPLQGGQSLGNGRQTVGQRVPLVRHRRQMVEEARQHLPLVGHLKVNAAHTVEDVAVAAGQDQVGPPAHHLDDQVFFGLFAHLVGTLQGQVHQPLHGRLGHGGNAAAGEVLAQQHAEHGRLGRILQGRGGQMEAGAPRRGREQQPSRAAGAPELEDHLIPDGHLNLVNAGAQQLGPQLRHGGGEKKSVKGHGLPPPWSDRTAR